MYICVCVCVCVYACMYVCMYICAHPHMYVYKTSNEIWPYLFSCNFSIVQNIGDYADKYCKISSKSCKTEERSLHKT